MLSPVYAATKGADDAPHHPLAHRAATLLALVIGLPILLVRVAGWPLPGRIPDWGHVGRMLQQGDITADPVVKTLAVILWLLWLAIVWSAVWELVTLPKTSREARPAARPAPSSPHPSQAALPGS